ncbi:MAG: LysM peptidoglycan-binding domain-containing protein, partial [Actinomycetales bacterium]|nr:LysM peptidoglycan-binding domain-containing protein [Actinomycetales bacterium]
MRVLQAIGAFGGLVMLIVGPPMALVTTIGNPWPAEGISLDAPLTDGAIMGALAVLVWVLWAQLMVCIVVEFAAAFTGDRVGGRVPFALGAQQQFARKLVTLILAGSIAVPVLTMASSAMATADAHASTPVSTQAESDPAAEEAEKTSNETRESHASVTVMRGDTLWAIAENELGDGSRWTEIAELNANRDMGDGSTFDSGRLIRPGWELIIPSTSQPAAEQKESNPVDHLVTKGDTLSHIALAELGDANRWPELFEASKDIDQPHPLVDPDLIYPGQRIVSKGSATTQAANPEPSAKISPTPKGDGSEPLPALESTSQDLIDELNVTQKSSTLPDLTTSALSVPTVEQDDQQLPGWVLPAFLGAGALLAAAVGFRLRQRRAAAARSRECGEVPETTPATVRRTEASIAVAGRPAEQVVAELDVVMAWIATTCLALGRDVPQLNTIEVNATHIALHWHTPEETIDRFTSKNGHMTWVTDRGQEWTLEDVTTDRPWPLVVAIGNDNDATWLLNFESTNVALTGDPDRNTAFIRHIVAGLAHSPWSRQVQLDVDQTLAPSTGFNPDRIQVHHNLDDVIAHDAVNVGYDIASRLAEPEARIATARVQGTDPDGWPA